MNSQEFHIRESGVDSHAKESVGGDGFLSGPCADKVLG